MKQNKIALCEGPECPNCGCKTTVYARIAEIQEHGEKAVIGGIVCENVEEPHRYEYAMFFKDIFEFEVIPLKSWCSTKKGG